MIYRFSLVLVWLSLALVGLALALLGVTMLAPRPNPALAILFFVCAAFIALVFHAIAFVLDPAAIRRTYSVLKRRKREAEVLVAAPIGPARVVHANNSGPAAPPEMLAATHAPHDVSQQSASGWPPIGIGGWLILPAIGLLVGPFRVAIDIVPILELMPRAGASSALLLVLTGELVANLFLIGFGIYTAYLFFNKRRETPKTFIALMWTAVAIQAGDIVAVVAVFGPVTEPGDFGALIGATIVAVIWTAYFRRSQRVASTFVEEVRAH